jgi:hypothetical protein
VSVRRKMFGFLAWREERPEFWSSLVLLEMSKMFEISFYRNGRVSLSMLGIYCSVPSLLLLLLLICS